MDAHTTGWSRMVRSPADIEIGQGGAPFLVGLTWQQWHGGVQPHALDTWTRRSRLFLRLTSTGFQDY
jgi:hypothetical protein